MILGTGVDLAEVRRIQAAITRHGRRFIERIYTPAEIAYVERRANRFERYAGRFAAKEAGMKAIGTGWKRGVRWQDFEVANLPSGQPTLGSTAKPRVSPVNWASPRSRSPSRTPRNWAWRT